MGPLPDFWASGKPVGLGNGIFWTHQLGWTNLGAGLAGQLGWVYLLESSIFAQKTAFLESKRALSSVFWAFFDLGTSLAEPDPNKTGLNLNPVEGKIRHVIESTSFPSPTGFPDPPRPPGDPPSPPQGGLKIICIIFQFFWWSRSGQAGNLLAVTPGRFAARGDGSPRLNGLLIV